MIFNIILVVLFYILKAISDKISFHFYDSIFVNLPEKWHDYWNPSESWDNKWLDNDKDNGERFYGSSTFLVMFTDAWHMIKFIQYIIVTLLIVLNAPPIFHPILDFPIYLFGGLAIFELFFSKIFKLR